MLTHKQKEKIVKDLKDKFKKAKLIIFTDFSGLKNKEIENLRERLKEENITYQVVKKTLLERVWSKVDYSGSVAVALSYDDQVALARILDQFSQEHENLKIISGILDGQFLEQAEILSLAKLPSKEEMLARIVGSVQAPINSLLNVLKVNTEKLILILKRKEKNA